MGKALPVLLVLVLVTLLSAACSGSATPAAPAGGGATPGPAQPYPVATNAPAPAASPTASSVATPTPATAAKPYPVAPDGKALVGQVCVTCHSLTRVETAKKSQADWLTTVNRMKGNGASLDETETQAVVAYLAATFK